MAVNVDTELYYFVQVANESRERYGLAPGVIEDLVAHVKTWLGDEYLASLLKVSNVGAGLMSESLHPLRTWLHGPSVDKHVLQLLELAALFRFFEKDPALNDKLEKLKHDSLWPVMFELATAYRLKSALPARGQVGLCREQSDAVGDFYMVSDGRKIACECSRLGYPPEEEEQFRILDDVYRYIDTLAKGSPLPRCVKIKVSEPLTGQIFNPRLVGRIKKANIACERTQEKSTSTDSTIEVTVEPLTLSSEKIPFAMVEGRVVDQADSDWTSATSICYVRARDNKHVADMHRAGDPMNEIEYARVFVQFPRATHRQGPYNRLNHKIKSKLTQTKLPKNYAGRLVFIEWTFGFERADIQRIHDEILDRVKHTSQTLGVIVCSRQGTPRYRHHYASTGSLNELAMREMPELKRAMEVFQERELDFDPITGDRYVGTWEEAKRRATADRKAAELKELRREGRIG